MEEALLTSIGFLPILITIFMQRISEKRRLIIRTFYLLTIITSYVIAVQLNTVGMLVMVFLASGVTLALFSDFGIMLEYSIISVVTLAVSAIFQMEKIEAICAPEIYLSYLALYLFAQVALLFMIKGVNTYKEQMEIKNEEARNALEAKSNFLANMSHEIRTPMNAIYGMAEILSQRKMDREAGKYVQTIQKSSESLLSIINEILDFSKIDSGKMEINEDEYSINTLLDDVLSIITFRLMKKSVKLNVDIDPGIPRSLIGDELRIKQILINLLNNAVNFTYRGHIDFIVYWDYIDEYNGNLIVEVRDTGIGISQENINKLFTAFGQIDTRKNRNVEGTGLGLVISKQLLNLMGGDIKCESVVKEGSTFSFHLPQKVRDPRPCNYKANYSEIRKENDEFKVTFMAPTARVMIVDDNKVNLQVAFELMKRFGFEATLVDNGMEAINKIDEHLIDYDVIFMDHMMPFLDGVEAAKKIRALDTPYARDIPIIALTANAIKGVEKQFKEAGMNDYVFKPIHIERLNEVLSKWIPFDKQIRKLSTGSKNDIYSEAQNGRLQGATGPISFDITDNLPGVDVEDGLRNCAGNKGVYIRVLQTFASSNLLASLEKFYQAGDWANYAVIAHSIKGACNNIGAKKVGEIAYEMEKAGKAGDKEFIDRHHILFSRQYGDMVKIVTNAVIMQTKKDFG
jgi:signal transduction histidine kinase/FixJ family two-component response regulator/HPt (histidine-containing phosphotransfer) domain-containing protein